MIGELLDHSRRSWNHVLSGESTLAEKVEVAAEAAVGVAAIGLAARFGFRTLGRAEGVAHALGRAEDAVQAYGRPIAALSKSGASFVESALGKAAGSSLPELEITGAANTQNAMKQFSFLQTQRIQLRAGETGAQLHERLRPEVIAKMQAVREPTEITTHSWYTADLSKTLGIKDAVAVMTSTCKHETPYLTFVGRRNPAQFMEPVLWPGGRFESKGLMSKDLAGNLIEPTKWRYKLYDLGRELTTREKNAIYDLM